MSGAGQMMSELRETPVRTPGSPSKSTLQRGTATYKQSSRPASADLLKQGESGEVERGRARTKPSPVLGKENCPLLAEENSARGEAKPSKMSILRGLSPERKGRSDAKSCVSPTKRDRSKPDDYQSVQRGRGGSGSGRSHREIDEEFIHMLAELEVPATLRLKLAAMDSKVKESMLRGQATLSLAALSAATSSKSRPGISDRLRKSKSSGSIIADDGWEELNALSPPNKVDLFGGGPQSRSTSGLSSTSAAANETRKASQSSPVLSSASSVMALSGGRSRSGSFSSAAMATNTTATFFATMLKTTDSSRLDVARVKKMRAVLSAESPSWIGQFVEQGGYAALLARLNELLSLEWREEQHDDQLLHELLRCLAALATTDRGRATLQSMVPTPFIELSNLLFSDKRPGDLSTRKVLIELLTLLAELPSSVQTSDLDAVRSARETSKPSAALLAEPTLSNFALLFTLLHNLRDPSKEAKVDFITASHAPRPFKAFVSEFLNINRDYFWVFCHSNRFWSLQDINIDDVECPKVPGGMTGGVEFEAMAYLTSLLRLLNTVCAQLLSLARMQKNKALVWDFHSLLFSSGIDRALAMTRKASQTYYQPLHLELARYFDQARQANYRLPAELEAWQSSPQLLATEHRYNTTREIPGPPMIQPAGVSADRPRPAPSDGEKAKVSTGKWFAARGQDTALSPASPPKLAERGGFESDLSLGPRLPNPHAESTGRAKSSGPEKSRTEVQQASLVGNAVMKWEQLANVNTAHTNQKHPGGLGLGWAPPR